MKRMTAIVMALVLAVTICACGGKGAERGTQTSDKSGADTTAVSAHTEQDTDKQKEAEGTDGAEKRKTAEESAKETVSTGSTGEQADTEDEDMAALEALGDVETENGILTVSITVPADLVGETTQEDLDASKGELYQSALLNDDGSVTYKMTKKQHRAMLENIGKAVDEGAQEMIEDEENYTISAVTHNEDCTEYNVTLDGTEGGFDDYFACYSFFMYGMLYGKFSGHIPEHIVVNYYDPDGNLIETMDSAELEDSEDTQEDEEYVNTGENTY